MKDIEKSVQELAEKSNIFSSTLEKIEEKLLDLLSPLFEEGRFLGVCGECTNCFNGPKVKEYGIRVGDFKISDGGSCYYSSVCFVAESEYSYTRNLRISRKDLTTQERRLIVKELLELPKLLQEKIKTLNVDNEIEQLNKFLEKFE